MTHGSTSILLGTALAAVLAPTAFAQADAPVVINEFNYDDDGTDDQEFVELYNATNAPIDIGDWHLDGIDDNGGPDNVATIPTGTMLAAGDYYVIGMVGVPNLDLDVTANSDWQNSNEALTLYDSNGRLVDTVIYEANKGVGAILATLKEGDDGLWGNLQMNAGIETSWSRIRDGYDTGRNGLDFRIQPWTPGTSNDNSTAQYADDFDANAAGTTASRWGGSFVAPIVVDPTVIDANNPSGIPPSPQGGNAAVFWDPSGGGNSAMLDKDPAAAQVFEAWVYFEEALLLATEYDLWSVGFGASGSFYNSPDPAGTFGFTANGNTGVNWTYVRDGNTGLNELYLVDNNDGGWGAGAVSPATVLAGPIPVAAGRGGWQRLKLSIVDGVINGNFGGTYGANDGVQVGPFLASMRFEGGLHGSYREAVPGTATARPLTMDGVRVKSCGDASAQISATCPPAYHSLNGPVLSFGAAPNDLPRVGGAIDIVGSSMTGGPFCGLLMGVELASPIALAPFGGLPGSLLCIDPVFATAPCSGLATTTVTLGIPNDPDVCDTVMSFQWLDWDQNLSGLYPLAYGTSGVGTVKVGL